MSIIEIDQEVAAASERMDGEVKAGKGPFRSLINLLSTMPGVSVLSATKSSRLRNGVPWLKTAMVQAAWSAVKKKESYYRAQFHRLKAHRGAKKAICAVAASILTAVYHMLKNGVEQTDLGANNFDRRSTDLKAKRASPT
jgi:hypothetical protein